MAAATEPVLPAIDRRDWRYAAVVIALLVVAVACIYGQVGSHEYVNFDDDVYVAHNPHLAGGLTAANVRWAFTSYYASNWHPLTWLSYMFEEQTIGLSAAHEAAVNALFHLLAAILCFLWLWRATRYLWRSAIVALLFAVHPMHVESVAWVSERKDVLSTFFFFLALLLYAAYAERRSPGAYAGALVSFALGLLAKPMIITLPFVLLLADYWPHRRLQSARELPRRIVEKLPFFALVIPSAILTLRAQQSALASSQTISFLPRLANSAIAYVTYAVKAFWPGGLAVFYPYRTVIAPSLAAVCALLLIALTVAAVWLGGARRWLAVGWLWFLGTLVPVIGIVQVGQQSMADRYTYIPFVGLFLIVVWAVAEAVARAREGSLRLAAAAVAAVVLIVFTVQAHAQTGYWQNSITLFSRAAEVTSNNTVAHINLGTAYLAAGDYARAEPELAQAVALKPDVLSLTAYGRALQEQGKVDLAAEQFRRAIQVDPSAPTAYARLAEIEGSRGNAAVAQQLVDRAIPRFRDALAKESASPATLHNDLAAALARKGADQQALAEYDAALRLDPTLYDAHMNRGALLSRIGRDADAITDFTEAGRLHPQSPEPHVYAALVESNRGQFSRAIDEVNEALRIDPRGSNQFFTNAVRMPFRESNLRDWLAFLGQQSAGRR